MAIKIDKALPKKTTNTAKKATTKGKAKGKATDTEVTETTETTEAVETAPQMDSKGVIKDDTATVTKSFLKKGNAAQQALQAEQDKADSDAKLRTEVRTFWMRPESETTITFLDGDLDPEHGMLDVPLLYNHNVYNANMGAKGERVDIACIRDTGEECPLCAHDKPTLVAALTIIEHIEYESNGETVSNPRRIFLCKRSTLRELQEAATHLGGLTGHQFKVRRTGKRKASVGDEYNYVGHVPEDTRVEAFPEPNPIDYENALVCLSATELYEMGVVDGVAKGYDNNQGHAEAAPSAASYSSNPMGNAPSKGSLPNSFAEEL